LLAGLCLFAACLPVLAAPVGEVTHLTGTLSSKQRNGSVKLLSLKSQIEEGDELSTQDGTYARIKFNDGAELVLRPNTQLKVDAYSDAQQNKGSDNIVLSLLRGGLRAVTGLVAKRNRDSFQLKTPAATIGIRGTHFGVLVCNGDCQNVPTINNLPPNDGTHVDVASGSIIIRNAGGTMVITPGQFGFVANLQTPPIIMPPGQGAPVTMPSSISQNNSNGIGIGQARDAECAM